eukprot:IDg23274t1
MLWTSRSSETAHFHAATPCCNAKSYMFRKLTSLTEQACRRAPIWPTDDEILERAMQLDQESAEWG